MDKDPKIDEKDKENRADTHAPHERELLPMEKSFNQWAYGGISFLAQALTGSALTYWIRHASGRPVYDKIAKWVGPNFIEKFGKYKGTEAIKKADSFITIATMVMVGNLFLIPLKMVENKKKEIVARWTKEDNAERTAKGEAPSEEELKHQQQLLAELNHAPKQSWLSLGLGRSFALATVFSADRIMEHMGANKKLETLTIGTNKAIANGLGLKKLAQWKPFEYVSSLAFYDGFYSMISAGGLFVYSHFVVPPKKHTQTEPFTKELIAPNTSLETTPPAKNFVSHAQHKSSDSFTNKVLASQQHANLQMAL